MRTGSQIFIDLRTNLMLKLLNNPLNIANKNTLAITSQTAPTHLSSGSYCNSPGEPQVTRGKYGKQKCKTKGWAYKDNVSTQIIPYNVQTYIYPFRMLMSSFHVQLTHTSHLCLQTTCTSCNLYRLISTVP